LFTTRVRAIGRERKANIWTFQELLTQALMLIQSFFNSALFFSIGMSTINPTIEF
jgi:hypothetical protein